MSNAGAERLKVVLSSVEAGEELSLSQNALLRHEIARQEAEEQVQVYTQRIKHDVENINRLLTQAQISPSKPVPNDRSTPASNRSIGTLHLDDSHVPSTPPQSPKKSGGRLGQATVSTPPATPTQLLASARTTPARGCSFVEDPNFTPSRNGKIYIVFLGRGNGYGLYHRWFNSKNTAGALSIYDPDCHNHIVKKFVDIQEAQRLYQEYLASDIPDLLQKQEPADNERFIVVEGSAPMACRNRKDLFFGGLQFRFQGATVYRYLGSFEGAKAKFREFQKEGLTREIEY
ncbi:hypothetical protein GGU10DRAFT_376929 [Lentinula aff. detonsa]|uniref:Uncharacterized protein n=1 Tax=Lentinula aff. detonsa TaxID=2804958 RepID=A0AA38NPC8_9AGAR|nr:hypothetical protein GGU10DRAFT_376929 [Lentinula aff. detonsa]